MLSPRALDRLISVVSSAPDGSADPRRRRAAEATAQLSDRELEVARAVAHGWSNAEIATELYMATATVKAYVSRLITKLGVENRIQVALLVHDAGPMDGPDVR